MTGEQDGVFALAIVMVAAIVAVLVVWMILRRRSLENRMVRVIDRSIERLGRAVQHHAEVNALVALIDEFRQDPRLIQRLAEYTTQVRAAALFHCANALGSDIKACQADLSRMRGLLNTSETWRDHVTRLEDELERLNEQLEAVNRAAQEFGQAQPIPAR